jgi:ABC-type branched-subunit amino acid transport system substrate-binding protein
MKRSRTTRTIALFGLVVLLVAACKAPDESSDSRTDDSVASTAPGRGVDDDAIRVGVTYVDLAAVGDVLPALDHGDYQASFEAFATAINHAGGVGGRQLELVFAPTDPIQATASNTMCTRLVEDEHVFVVVAPQVRPAGVTCLTADQDTALVGGTQSAGLLDQAAAPWFAYDPSVEWAAEQTVAGVLEAGELDAETVAIVALSEARHVAEDVVRPMLEDAGIDVAEVAVQELNQSDPSAAEAENRVFLERFQSQGVEAVVVVDEAFTLFARALSSTDHRPQVIATNVNPVNAHLVTGGDPSILEDAVAGGAPSWPSVWTQPETEQCLETLHEVAPEIEVSDPRDAALDAPNTWVAPLLACEAMELFRVIAEEAGDTLNNDTFAAAGASLGEITLPNRGGPSDFTAGVPSGDPPVFLSRLQGDDRMVSDPEPVS